MLKYGFGFEQIPLKLDKIVKTIKLDNFFHSFRNVILFSLFTEGNLDA